MKIQDIVNEYVEPGIAQANKTTLDNEILKKKELEVAAQQGIDTESEELTQDLPV